MRSFINRILPVQFHQLPFTPCSRGLTLSFFWLSKVMIYSPSPNSSSVLSSMSTFPNKEKQTEYGDSDANLRKSLCGTSPYPGAGVLHHCDLVRLYFRFFMTLSWKSLAFRKVKNKDFRTT
ncbi:hypothetical protein CDL15_Pgr008368 [Punica granatum]|uniref:Uncharacterized protein n=1 Tax=Punica granatum TaxID=22663 RepID=A0A218WMH5_PUNGR|nr:hypothetical protein CDL15_Pgr008368 [Punica granatum]